MAGVAHFLASVWRSHTARPSPPPLPSPAPPSPPPATCEARHSSARHSGSMTLLLPAPLFAWLSAHASQHNLGSVHKSVRDLLMWGADVGGQELAWVLLRPADAHASQLARQLAASGFGAAEARALTGEAPVRVETRLPPRLQRWLAQAVRDYGLAGPSDVLEAVARVAVELDAADDVFESVDAGHDLPRSSADLYYDLGIRGFACARDAPACVSPPPAGEPRPPEVTQRAATPPPMPRAAMSTRERPAPPPARRTWLSVAH